MRKDRSYTQDKSGGGLILYFRNSLNCRRRSELRNFTNLNSKGRVNTPNSKPILICTVYRPPNALSE